MQPCPPRLEGRFEPARRRAPGSAARAYRRVGIVLAVCAPRLLGHVLAVCAPRLLGHVLAVCAPRLLGHVLAACAACIWIAGTVEAATEPPGISGLEGEWYVLAHFREATARDTGAADDLRADAADDLPANSADAQDYRDAVWRIEREGDRLRWTIHPDFGFRDESGRFEDVRGARARIPHAWRPTAAQLGEIRAGLEVEDRSARTRTLRSAGSNAWRSGGGARPGNASSVAYGEIWSIELRGDGRPIFERAAALRSGRAGSMEGVTLFEAELFDGPGGYIEGRYARDGRAHGRFYMWRKGAASDRDRTFVQIASERSLLGPGGPARLPVVVLEQRIAGNDESRAERTAIRAGIRELVEESYTRRGLAVHPHEAEIEALTSEIERLAVVEGVPLVEIERRFAAGELAP